MLDSLGRPPLAILALAWVTLATCAGMAWQPGVAVAATATVTITPDASGGHYHNGQLVNVAVGANRLFQPNTRVIIIECADPGGTQANLPTSFSTCDGNTVQGDSVVVQADGSLAEHGYTLYSLPNSALGEQAGWQPVCNPTHACVLFVGEDQNDFTKPKIFSQPFTLTTATVTAATSATPTTSQPAPTTSAATPPSAAVSLSPATLAYTGAPDRIPWLVGSGLGLLALGFVTGRRIRRWGR